MTSKQLPPFGLVIFGVVNDHPPAHWRYTGRRGGARVLEHVRPAAQSVAYRDQYVSLDALLALYRRWLAED